MNLFAYAAPTSGYRATLRERKAALIAFEVSPETVGFLTEFSGKVEGLDYIAAAHGRVLAHRTWEGAWVVLDARVSALLPVIDNYVEGDATP